jgi:hypothetical protein
VIAALILIALALVNALIIAAVVAQVIIDRVYPVDRDKP